MFILRMRNTGQVEVEVKYKVEVEAQSGSGKVCRVEVEVIMTKLNWNDTNGPPYLSSLSVNNNYSTLKSHECYLEVKSNNNYLKD